MKSELYRGVSKEKFERDGKIIKPQKIGPFESIIHLDEGHCLDEGFTLDASENNSVVKHQKDSGKYPTSGISTTLIFQRAKHYATSGGKKHGYVFIIDRTLLAKYNVKEFIVSQFTDKPNIPEDEEVILYSENGNELPNDLIIKIEEILS